MAHRRPPFSRCHEGAFARGIGLRFESAARSPQTRHSLPALVRADQQLPVVFRRRDRKRIAGDGGQRPFQQVVYRFAKDCAFSGVCAIRGETFGKNCSSRLGMYCVSYFADAIPL